MAEKQADSADSDNSVFVCSAVATQGCVQAGPFLVEP
jgi:hypothetical protein